jgi:large subunit ribosomal protein L4
VQSTLIRDINTYDIVNADAVLMTEGAAKVFAEAQEEETA